MNRAAFYDAIRPDINLTTENVPGFDKHLDYGIETRVRLDKMAYALATSSWETGNLMRPVTEAHWLSENWRKKNLRYYPWHGRGLIQTTWEENYRTMSKVLGVNLLDEPDLLLEWNYALPALFVGMEQGLYTGKAFDDYLDGVDESDAEDLREYANARRIVNGSDKQIIIGKRALAFERGLKAMGWGNWGSPDIPLPKPNPDPEPPIVGDHDVRAYQSQLARLGYTVVGPIDGVHGRKTELAVRAFQENNGLRVDGIVGLDTQAALDAALKQPDDPGPVSPPETGWFTRWKGAGGADRLR